jgi:hypothetical protein
MFTNVSKNCANRVDENHVKKMVHVGALEIVRLLSNFVV